MDDRHAVERIRRGDWEGLRVLVNRYQERAVRAAYAVTQDRALAEDVSQTAFVKLTSSLRTFDPKRPFAPWFLTGVVHAAVKAAKQRDQAVSLDAPAGEGSGDTFADLLPDVAALPGKRLELKETQVAIWAALEQLSPDQRAVIVLRYYLELDTPEIANRLQRPATTIRWRLHSAHHRLRGLLAALVED